MGEAFQQKQPCVPWARGDPGLNLVAEAGCCSSSEGQSAANRACCVAMHQATASTC